MLEQARRAHSRIEELNAIIAEGGFDWRPDAGHSSQVGNPTESQALASMVLLAREHAELQQLFELVGECLRIIAGVRTGLGEQYADVLDCYYVDAMAWADVATELQITEQWARSLRNVAVEWAESMGLARVLTGRGSAT